MELATDGEHAEWEGPDKARDMLLSVDAQPPPHYSRATQGCQTPCHGTPAAGQRRGGDQAAKLTGPW